VAERDGPRSGGFVAQVPPARRLMHVKDLAAGWLCGYDEKVPKTAFQGAGGRHAGPEERSCIRRRQVGVKHFFRSKQDETSGVRWPARDERKLSQCRLDISEPVF